MAGHRLPTNWRVLHAIADRALPLFEVDFARGVKAFQKRVNLREVAEAVEAGDITGAFGKIPFQDLGEDLAKMGTRYRDAVGDAGDDSKAFYRRAIRNLMGVDADISFSVDNPRVARFVSDHIGELIVEVTDDTKLVVQDVIRRGAADGLPPRRTAALIRDHIGLTSYQTNAALNYRAGLFAQGVKGDKLEQRFGAYVDRAIKNRAATIARTETMHAVNAGQILVWDEMAATGVVDARRMTKVWIVTPDDALCPMCEGMSELKAEVDGTFNSPDIGPVDTPPLHPNCRCVLGLEVDV